MAGWSVAPGCNARIRATRTLPLDNATGGHKISEPHVTEKLAQAFLFPATFQRSLTFRCLYDVKQAISPLVAGVSFSSSNEIFLQQLQKDIATNANLGTLNPSFSRGDP